MKTYSLLPFEFKRCADDTVLLVNECGDYLFLSSVDFKNVCEKRFNDLSIDVRHLLVSRHMISDSDHMEMALELCANKYRSRREYLVSAH